MAQARHRHEEDEDEPCHLIATDIADGRGNRVTFWHFGVFWLGLMRRPLHAARLGEVNALPWSAASPGLYYNQSNLPWQWIGLAMR